MGWFDDENEDETIVPPPPVAPSISAPQGPTTSTMMPPAVADYLKNKYLTASDDKEVKAAQSGADRAQMTAGILSGLGQMFTAKSAARGGRTFDPSALNQMAAGAQRKVGDAQQERQQRMQGVLQEDQLEWTGKERGNKEKEWSRKEADWARDDDVKKRENDPTSEESQLAQTLAKKMMPSKDFSGASATQLKQSLPLMEKIYSAETSRRAALSGGGAKSGDWQILQLQNPDGPGVVLVNYNKLTGERRPIDGIKGWKPTITKDAVTGEIIQVVPGGAPPDRKEPMGPPAAPTEGVAPDILPNESPNQYKARLGAWKAGQSKLATEQAKDINAAEGAEAQADTRANVRGTMINLYDAAEKEGGVGPISGRVSGIQSAAGVSAGESTDKLMTTAGLSLAEYVKQQSGLNVTDKEQERLEKLLPSAAMDRATFVNRTDAALAFADQLVNEKRLAAGMAPRPGAKQTPPPAAFPRTVRNGTKKATVSNQAEADAAAAKGYK